MAHGRFDNPVVAALAGVKDFFRKQDLVDKYTDDIRLDGKTCLITGANSGLGFGIAVEMARRGAHVIMAGRSAIPQAGEKVKQMTGSSDVRMEYIDLSKLDTIHALVHRLKADGTHIDRLVLNAGVALPKGRKLDNGQEEMFFVNYLSNVIFVNMLLKEGIMQPKFDEDPDRIIFISSDSHQGSSAVDYDEFGKFVQYGVSKGIGYYSYYKLVLNTFATELSRRINNGQHRMAIHVMCPGPVNSKITKEGPKWLQGVLGVIFYIFFKDPVKAARPVVYMAAADEYGNSSNEYLHMFNRKEMDPKVYEPDAGTKLWEESIRLWSSLDSEAYEYSLSARDPES